MVNNILVLTVTFNDEYLSNHFYNHYTKYLNINPANIIVHDNHSTDNTIPNLIKCGIPKENIVTVGDPIHFSDPLNAEIKNQWWKSYKVDNPEIKWIICVDFDEFLYHPYGSEGLVEYLNNYEDCPVPVVKGINIIASKYIKSNKEYKKSNNILDIYNEGVWDSLFSKNVIFDGDYIETMNYNWGCHKCDPTPKPNKSVSHPLFLLHLKKIKEVEQYKLEQYKPKIKNDGAVRWYAFASKLSDDKCYIVSNYRYAINDVKEMTKMIVDQKKYYIFPTNRDARGIKYRGGVKPIITDRIFGR